MLRYMRSKQLKASLLAALFICSNSGNYILAQDALKVAPKSVTISQKTVETKIPGQLEADIKDSIVALYGKENVNTVYNSIVKIINKTMWK